jgi:hypothetical protein
MNVQMRLITADNIEQLTKQGDRRINDKQFNQNLSVSPKEEDIFERLKRENEEIAKFESQKNPNLNLDLNMNNNAFIVEPELLSKEEKKQLLNMNDQQIRAFIEGHNVSDLTPKQKENFSRIVGSSIYYMRLEQEISMNDLYKTVLRDEINKMFEPTNSEKQMYKEMYGENLDTKPGFKLGTTFGGGPIKPSNDADSQPIIIKKEDYEQHGGSGSDFGSISESSELSQSESIEDEHTGQSHSQGGETKVIKI